MIETILSQKINDTEHVTYTIRQLSRHSDMSTSFGSFDSAAEAAATLTEIGAAAHDDAGWFPAHVVKTRVLTTTVVTKWIVT